jgi:hypothetical protein
MRDSLTRPREANVYDENWQLEYALNGAICISPTSGLPHCKCSCARFETLDVANRDCGIGLKGRRANPNSINYLRNRSSSAALELARSTSLVDT